MAKYSKEQRRCAVELYVRYECRAADVIRELGYPSREALRMWHRDWLEEQRTGVPSSRGERYARYTAEQKRAAADHYPTHGRRAGRTIRRLGYPSRTLLAARIDELAPGERRPRHGPVPEGLKREAVLRVVSGEMTSREAAEELGVDPSVVRNWKRQLPGGTRGRSGKGRTGTRGCRSTDGFGCAARRDFRVERRPGAVARRIPGDGDQAGDHEGVGGTGGKRAGRRPGQPDKPGKDDPDQKGR